jgi:hypothetical protein
MALQLPVSNHQWQPHDEQLARSKDRRPRLAVAKAELDQGSVSRHDARPAGAPSSTRAIAPGVRLKWCGDELDPTKAEQVTWFVLSTVLLRKGWLSRLRPRCRKTALNEQGTRGVRRKALNRSQLECLSLEEWSRTSLLRRLPRPAPLRGVSVPEVRFGSFAYVPRSRKGSACDHCEQPSPHATRLSGRSEVTPVKNEGVSPSSCARTHGGGEETTTLR